MARAGADLDGVVVFHGSLAAKEPVQSGQIKSEIMVFTGAADPFVPHEHKYTHASKEKVSPAMTGETPCKSSATGF